MNYKNHKYNNTVIRAVTEKEENQVLDWWENKGEELDKNIWNNCNDIVAYEPYITFKKIN